MKKFFHRDYLVYYILAVALLIRLLLLFTGQQFVDGDEGVVGVMARHITQGASPLARYGQHYGGGHVIEAYLAAFLFLLTGVTNSGILLKLPIVIFSLLVLHLSYLITKRFASHKLALVTAGLLAVAAPFLRSGFKANGYIETIFFCLLSFYYVCLIIIEGRSTLKNYFWCGFWWGVGFWCFGFAIMYLAILVPFFLVQERFDLFKGKLWLFGGGGILGSLILIIDNILNNKESLAVVLTGENSTLWTRGWLSKIPGNLGRIFTHELPAFLGREAIHNFVVRVPPASWIYYGLLLLAVACSVFLLTRQDFPGKKLIRISLVFLGVYLVIYAITPFAGVSPRYFLGLFPFISILIALLFVSLIGSSVNSIRYLGLILLVTYFSVQTVFAGQMAHNRHVLDLKVRAQADDVQRLIGLLDQIGVKYVHTGFFTKWRLIFESDERIIASCLNLGPKIKKYPEYEKRVERSINYAVVLHTATRHRQAFQEFLRSRRVKHRSKVVADFTVFYDIEGNFRP